MLLLIPEGVQSLLSLLSKLQNTTEETSGTCLQLVLYRNALELLGAFFHIFPQMVLRTIMVEVECTTQVL